MSIRDNREATHNEEFKKKKKRKERETEWSKRRSRRKRRRFLFFCLFFIFRLPTQRGREEILLFSLPLSAALALFLFFFS